MNEQEREMDLALAECEAENRLLRARNERLEKELALLKSVIGLSELATELEHTLEENNKLRDRLVLGALPESEQAKFEIHETLDDYRAQIKNLERELLAVIQSRNDYQQKNSDLIRSNT